MYVHSFASPAAAAAAAPTIIIRVVVACVHVCVIWRQHKFLAYLQAFAALGV